MDYNSLVRDTIKNLKPYVSARDEFADVNNKNTFLDANENPFGYKWNRYPDPYQKKLKNAISTLKGVSIDQILLGNGSDEVLDLILRAFCNPGIDNIITLPPTYGMYKVLAAINNIENIEVLLTKEFGLNVNEILNVTNAKSKVLFLCSPNNPTGNSFSTEKIEKLLNNFKGLVVLDEAYIDFSTKKSWLNRLNEFPNLIITQTLSKAYGLAGIRLGICYASPQIISILNKIKPPYNVNGLTQKKALKKLGKTNGVQKQVASIVKQRKKLIHSLNKIAFISKIHPTDANFILVEVDDATERYNQLIDKKIVVRNRTLQPLCKNCLRITVGTKKDNEKLINALKEL